MSVITFSTKFPGKHPQKGQPTYFVEAILTQLGINYKDHEYFISLCKWNRHLNDDVLFLFSQELSEDIDPKGHTIRIGTKRKVGDKFSPRVWSGKPYVSKQIQFAPDIEILKLWNVQIAVYPEKIYAHINGNEIDSTTVSLLAKNDGLSLQAFRDWFTVHPKTQSKQFAGQIICWDNQIQY